MKHSHIIHHYWTSPCGILDLASIGEELVMCDWVDGWHRAATLNRLTRLTKLPMVEDASSVIDLAQVQLAEYFDQRRQVFTVPLRLIGSEFQTRVWHALTKIPYGKTISYGEIAREVNSPKAVRAVPWAPIRFPSSFLVTASSARMVPSRAMAADMPPNVIFLRWNLDSRLTSCRSAAA